MCRTRILPEPPHAQGVAVHPQIHAVLDEAAHDSGATAPAGRLWSTVEDPPVRPTVIDLPEPIFQLVHPELESGFPLLRA